MSVFRCLDWLLRNSVHVLKSWSDRIIGNVRLQLEITKEVLHQLKKARDWRVLAPYEESLRQLVKLKSLSLTSLQCSIARQEAKLLWIREGGASKKFFHEHANSRRRQNHIRSPMDNGEVLLTEDRKADAIFRYFDEVLGSSPIILNSINLDLLDLPRVDPSRLGARFTEDEVWAVIHALPSDKAPRLDGFMARFLQVYGDLIKPDVMATLDAFWHLDTRDFHSANEALVVLLPKSSEASTIKDYRPISLIHMIGKQIAKILSDRLAP
jgi:hypothetical protein